MQQPVATDDNDVAINEVALQRAGYQSATQSVLKNFLEGAADEGDGEDADAYSLPEANGIEIHDESGGVGYIPDSANGRGASESRGGSAATELLRKQLLGKRAMNKTGGSAMGRKENRSGQTSSMYAPKPPRRRPRKVDSSDDEEDGRSRVGKKSRNSTTAYSAGMKTKPKGEDNAHDHDVSQQQASRSVKRASSYMDQLLDQRSAKKQKKKKQKSPQDV